MSKSTKLIFIYNADSGLLNAIKDSLHKTLSPKTYPCSLCALTYGSVSEKKIWKKFHQNSKVEMEFLHIDEFEKCYSVKFDYPVILRDRGKLEIALSHLELDKIKDVEALIKIISTLQ